ncbi:hypothetical protein B0T09DRAFT_397778 [Sordaria sp. MPI-SDFR-AT-0083]|nr:hypothetical protein B0T09DRAFT_397778 [Sordaria sp. MPI-SDFR-AT-0083]
MNPLIPPFTPSHEGCQYDKADFREQVWRYPDEQVYSPKQTYPQITKPDTKKNEDNHQFASVHERYPHEGAINSLIPHIPVYLREIYPQEHVHPQKQAYLRVTNQDTKNDEEIHHLVAASKQDVDRLVDKALQLTWDMCFDGTRVMFKEPETLTLIKLRGAKAVEADKLFMKVSPKDCRLKREQDTQMLKRFRYYKHILYAPQSSNNVFACCSIQLPILPPRGHRKSESCTTKTSVPTTTITSTAAVPSATTSFSALNSFRQAGISLGTDRGRNPVKFRGQGLKKYLVEKRADFNYFIDRMREEVLEKRGYLVTTEEDLKLGTFFDKGEGSGSGSGSDYGSDSGYVSDVYDNRGNVKRIGIIADWRPVVERGEKKEEEEDEEVVGEEETLKEVGPLTT